MGTIVVGVDGSERARAALRWALRESVRTGDRVRVLHAWHPPYLGLSPLSGSRVRLADVEERVRADVRRVAEEELAAVDGRRTADEVLEIVVVSDAPTAALLDAGRDADLLVVGTRGGGGVAGLLLGSTSHEVVARAPCPVVVVPSADRQQQAGDGG